MTQLGSRCFPEAAWSQAAFRLLLFFCLATLLFLPRAVQSQSGGEVHVRPLTPAREATPPAAEAGAVLYGRDKPLRIGVDVVLVPATVTDNMNRPVMGLGKQDFLVSEDDEPQEIRHFSQEDAPISIGVLLDLSKSMRNKIDVAREALGEFFRTANPQDDYFVITFADRPEFLADTTQSIGSIQAKLAAATPSGHTALLDAIYLGITKHRRARYPRRALLIISDGGDNHSRYRRQEIKRLVEEADVEIYSIGIFDSIFKTPEEWAGKRLLTEITEATGGRTVALDNPRQLPAVAAAISLELRNQYLLGYTPTNPACDGRWRKIKVRLAPSSGTGPMHVYSRQGYLRPQE